MEEGLVMNYILSQLIYPFGKTQVFTPVNFGYSDIRMSLWSKIFGI